MKALAVAWVVAVACIVGAGTADAATGTKVFLKDCTLNMSGDPGPGGVPVFYVYDFGGGCGQYLIRGASMVTASGLSAFDGSDDDESPTHELFNVEGEEPEAFEYGTVDVYIPYRSRCDRYRLYASNAVRHLDSRPCYGESYLNRLVDGPLVGPAAPGSGVIHPDDPRCDGDVYLIGEDAPYGPGEPPAQSGTVTTEYCVDITASPWRMYGTFEFTSATGALLRGTHEGTATESSFDLTYTVTSGTGQFRYATGTIHASSTYRLGVDQVLDFEASFVGSLVEAHLTVKDASVVEGDAGQSRMVFRVRLSAPRVVPVTVGFSIEDGSASRSSDYVFKQGTLTFQPGETSKVVGVNVNGDSRAEGNETLTLELFDSPNARITVPEGTGTILDDD